MLTGKYTTVMNKNNTIKIPKKLREPLGKNVILCIDFSVNCITIIPLKSWEEFKQRLKAQDPDESSRIISEHMLESAKIGSIDENGLLIVDDNLLHLAGITTECIFLGMGDCIELWDKGKFDEYWVNFNKEEIVEEVLRKLGM